MLPAAAVLVGQHSLGPNGWQPLLTRSLACLLPSIMCVRACRACRVWFSLVLCGGTGISAMDEGLRLGWGGAKEPGGQPRDFAHPNYPFRPGILV